ncbi:hypothetical protein A3K86_10980 [Photobacterium jeanii]|uniref:Uncharacterized protein n=1 Tax=Photobacterium jeanii TaxID=858640 RepID=A0A178KAM2_9GAMM|nr:hypothetical protein A3K86_10980 [Photobacterium jeanii]PST89623.1 hypothetical protein C9I91_11590 [Photobacterium jeanii]
MKKVAFQAVRLGIGTFFISHWFCLKRKNCAWRVFFGAERRRKKGWITGAKGQVAKYRSNQVPEYPKTDERQ